MNALVRPIEVAACLLLLLLCACESEQARVTRQTDMLAAAGFEARPASTPERQAMLRMLPANKFVRKARDDMFEYVYADPIVCNCIYVGDQTAYNNYKRMVFQRQIADEQQLTAQMYQGQWPGWNSWNWGPWGPRASWW
jgi:hypothetical protein